MSPRQVSTYKPPRNRREILLATVGVLAVLLFTVGMVLVLAPADETSSVPDPVVTTLPTDTSVPTDSSLPPDSTLPADPTATSAPATAPPGG